jgi:hydroxymethylpyrimidine/phosphomethylpyrimidine kinase
MAQPTRTPIALTIAGSDSGGGAGIQADLKTFSALGVYGTSAITVITAQNTCAVTAVEELPPSIVTAQIDAVLDDMGAGAIKVGMLSSTAIIQAVAGALSSREIPLVVDPVMVAKSGDRLLRVEALEALRTAIVPLATLLTPNLPEAADLLGEQEAADEESAEKQGRALLALGPQAVLMKGGHAKRAVCVDLLIRRDLPTIRFEAPRLDTKNTHGTGCTLSAAVAAGLAMNQPLETAVQSAHRYLQLAIGQADSLDIGRGTGPVHHFFGQWG